MSYNEEMRPDAAEKCTLIVDLRSDTLSKPTQAMKEAMMYAELGDDVYEEDPTVKKLEEKSAKLLGKEAAIFLTSGTMGNLIAMMNHCNTRGCEAYCGEQSHIFLHEQGGAASLGGILLSPIPNNPDGTFDLEILLSKLRNDNVHAPISKLVLVENTMNGKIVPQSWIEKLSEIARQRNLKMHLDGARIFNAAVASGISAAEIAKPFDSVTFCLSKGLGAAVGSLLCGSKDFIRAARRTRKVLGGGMRQVGILAAAGIVALDKTVPILKYDHQRAKLIAREINKLNSAIFFVDEKMVQTNMVVMTTKGFSAITFARRMQTVEDDDDDDKIIVRALPLQKHAVRFVLYSDITDEMVEAAIRKFRYVIKKLDNSLQLSNGEE